MAEQLALVPFVQLPDGFRRLPSNTWGDAEMAQAVLGIFVLALSAGWRTLVKVFWQGLVSVCGCVFVLGWRCATWEGVLSGWGPVKEQQL